MFSAYLWKEWRELRWMFMTFAVLIPIIHILGWCVLEPKDLWVERNAIFAFLPALLTALVITGILGCDLVTREKDHGRLHLLCRLPGDIRNPFWAKIIVLTIVIVAAWSISIFTLILADVDLSILKLSHRIETVEKAELHIALGVVLLLLLALGYLGIAISCWMPVSSMAVPATLLVFATYCTPYVLMWMPTWIIHGVSKHIGHLSRNVQPFPFDLEFILLLVLFLPGVFLAVAWLSFSCFKKGGTNLRSAAIGIPFLILCSLSLLGWRCIRHDAWYAPRTDAPDFEVRNALIGENGRFAFLTTRQRGTRNGIVLNLETGKWNVSEFNDSSFYIFDRHYTGKYGLINNNRMVNPRCPKYVGQRIEKGKVAIWDCLTGTRVHEMDQVKLPGFHSALIHYDRFILDFNRRKQRKDEWNRLCETMSEFNSFDQHLYLGNNCWFVKRKISKLEPGSKSGSAMNWVLYDANDNEIRPAPCGSYRGYLSYQDISYSDQNELVCSVVLSPHDHIEQDGKFIRQMIPCGERWLIVKSQLGVESIRPHTWPKDLNKTIDIWYPDSNRYEEKPIIEGVRYIEASMNDKWIVAYKGMEKPAHLINRYSLEAIELPEFVVNQIVSSPEGNLVIGGYAPHDDKRYAYLFVDASSGNCKLIKTQIDSHSRSYSCVVGVTDENTAYVFQNPYKNASGMLYKLDFTDLSSQAVFPDK